MHSVFRYADQVIGLIPGRRSRYVNLPAIQELTRNATTLLGENSLEGIETTTGVVQLVQQLLTVHIHDIPSRWNPAWDWPLARLRRGPPLMDKWYFFYGLLDCVAQLARYVRAEQFSVRLLSTLKQLMEESEYDELRWKILEILEAYEATSGVKHQSLGVVHGTSSNNHESLAPAEISAVKNILRQRDLAEHEALTTISRQGSGSYSMEDIQPPSHRAGCFSQGIEDRRLYPSLAEAEPRGGLSTLHNESAANVHPASTDAIEPCSRTDDSVSRETTRTGGRSLSLASQQPPHVENTDEANFEDYLEGNLSYWPQSGEIQVSRLLPSQGWFGRGYAHAGLATNCRLVFFFDSTRVCVFRVNLESRRARQEDMLLDLKYDRHSQVADVSLSATILAVSTRKALEVYRVGLRRPVEMVSHDDWDPSGIAICENPWGVMIAVGHRRATRNSRRGRVVFHEITLPPQGLLRRRIIREFTLPRGDSPKILTFDREGATLACITEISNSVILWRIGEGAPEDGGPTTIERCRHRPETDSDGLTSAAIYNSPTQQYLLCTTSASTERFRSRGEWSFTSPVVPTNEQVPPRTIHDLTAFEDFRQLVACAVSSVANKFAVLTKSGKILVLSLTGHEDGGICSRTDSPDIMSMGLCELKSLRATPDCLRFDPQGTKLYAVDPEGKLVVVAFSS